MITYILDTNIVSHMLRKNSSVIAKLSQAAADNAIIILCPVVYYEIQRGLMKRSAINIIRDFQYLSLFLQWEDIVKDDWTKAAEMWSQSQKSGSPCNDADILIASQSCRLNAILVTDNESHFKHLDVQIENWCKS